MLKSLDLFGFKSFADRTTFDFAPGVTCVVGPNGSGKSNVVDGLKWLLGDQSAKSLRGKEMTDVIFNGSAGRKPAGYAEATLTFDNSKGHLASEHREVLIGRRLYRSGESEYLINRQPVRLKDVRDLFLGSGAGTAAYSIIEQGRVDALLQTTTQNRRVVFEEAAGISRFNQRKQDALRRLERVGQNLVRLTDIVDEVKSQLDSVRSQAGKAARFREYSEELRRLRIGLAADDYRSMTEQLASIKEQNDQIDLRVKDLTEQHQAAEAEQSAIDSKVAELEDQLRGAEKRSAENRESIAGHEATILHQNARQAELNSELERLQQQQSELSTRARQAVGELEETTGTVQQFEEQVTTRQEELARQSEELRLLSDMIHEAREILEQDRARQLELLQLISILTNRKSSRRSTFDTQELTLRRLDQRTDQLRLEESKYLAELEVARLDLQAATDRLTALREEVRSARARRSETLELIETAQNAVRDQRERRSALEARRGLLEDLEQRQEGARHRLQGNPRPRPNPMSLLEHDPWQRRRSADRCSRRCRPP
ncbi:MAG: AAA family ATPase [Planctomycetales bacterium]